MARPWLKISIIYEICNISCLSDLRDLLRLLKESSSLDRWEASLCPVADMDPHARPEDPEKRHEGFTTFTSMVITTEKNIRDCSSIRQTNNVSLPEQFVN